MFTGVVECDLHFFLNWAISKNNVFRDTIDNVHLACWKIPFDIKLSTILGLKVVYRHVCSWISLDSILSNFCDRKNNFSVHNLLHDELLLIPRMQEFVTVTENLLRDFYVQREQTIELLCLDKPEYLVLLINSVIVTQAIGNSICRFRYLFLLQWLGPQWMFWITAPSM